MRLDNYLVENDFVESRNKAQTIVKEGLVYVNNMLVKKPAFQVQQSDEVRVLEHRSYVSRAAFKLDEFLNETGLHVKGKTALDIGSSTGGFTQVLLERGAGKVSCVDVGREQLHHSLRKDERVHVYENCDIRKFEPDKQFDLIVSDVAFISLLYILDDVDRLGSEDIILLFKPQFEVGREAKRDKNGVVTDKKAIANAMTKFEDACRLKNWQLLQKSPSKLTGKEGNLEYCYYFKK
ncbi:23S rRNA (cytidine-2'-O)-methyltransferase TlyA [Sulfurimonas autotrophica]|uniref:Hemolysin A n=1 Tax=Sulfurimonas autotrophica (strain ATCC BAA-671 / DSM 16294 / JCM 11897 / OK10) TaxID=563040 RepID=E0URC4_SULAO|nr:TlyA family RNA methyltransferase [Sulfurimonas autotrophica]ADN08934.1 hemolysin A [Sulfurimonas autotrophica DSM 16294]